MGKYKIEVVCYEDGLYLSTLFFKKGFFSSWAIKEKSIGTVPVDKYLLKWKEEYKIPDSRILFDPVMKQSVLKNNEFLSLYLKKQNA